MNESSNQRLTNNDMWYHNKLSAIFLPSILSASTGSDSKSLTCHNAVIDTDSISCDKSGMNLLSLVFVSKSVGLLGGIISNGSCCDCCMVQSRLIFPDFKSKIISLFWDLLLKGCCCLGDEYDELALKELLYTLGLKWVLTKETFSTANADSDSESGEGEISLEEENFVGQCFDMEDNIALVGDDSCQNFQYCDEDSNLSDIGSPLQFHCEVSRTDRQCSRFCNNRCDDIRKSWAAENIVKLENMFTSENGKIQDVKNNLLRHLWSQHNIGESTECYVIFKQAFCIKFLSKAIDVSEYILKQVLDAFWSGRTIYRHGNTGGIKQPTVATTNFICWLKIFAESYGQYAPDTNTVVLNYWANKGYLFNLYSNEAPTPLLSKSAFYQNFDKYFSWNRVDKSLPHVVISKYSSHSVCNQCVAINYYMTQCKTEAQLHIATDLKNQHRMLFGDARKRVEEIKQTAIQFPSENLFIQVYWWRIS